MAPRLSHAEATWDEECRSTNNRLPRELLAARDGGKLFLCHYPLLLRLAVLSFISCRSLAALKAPESVAATTSPNGRRLELRHHQVKISTLLHLADRLLLATVFLANSVVSLRTAPARAQSLATTLRHNMQGNIKRGDGVVPRPRADKLQHRGRQSGWPSSAPRSVPDVSARNKTFNIIAEENTKRHSPITNALLSSPCLIPTRFSPCINGTEHHSTAENFSLPSHLNLDPITAASSHKLDRLVIFRHKIAANLQC